MKLYLLSISTGQVSSISAVSSNNGPAIEEWSLIMLVWPSLPYAHAMEEQLPLMLMGPPCFSSHNAPVMEKWAALMLVSSSHNAPFIIGPVVLSRSSL